MPYDPRLYPVDWPEIARRCKQRAGYRCRQCGAGRGQLYLDRFGVVRHTVITVAHLDHDPWNPRARLRVLCARCHLRYDGADQRRRRVMMQIARGQLVLFPALFPRRVLRL